MLCLDVSVEGDFRICPRRISLDGPYINIGDGPGNLAGYTLFTTAAYSGSD